MMESSKVLLKNVKMFSIVKQLSFNLKKKVAKKKFSLTNFYFTPYIKWMLIHNSLETFLMVAKLIESKYF